MNELSKAMSLKDILAFQYDLLGHEKGEITEIRFLPSTVSYFPTSKEEFVEAAQEAIKEGKEEGENVYVGINPRRTSEPGKADTIPFLTAFVVDIDPVRGKDEPSTDHQHGLALNRAEAISLVYKGHVADSGSGAHVYIPLNRIAIKDPEAITEDLRNYFKEIKDKYATKDLKLDPIFDLPRIIRLWGSHNHKSNRPCLPIGPLVSVPRITLALNQEPKAKKEAVVSGTEVDKRLQRLCKTNRRLKDLRDGTIAFGSKSEADFAFTKELRKAQFSENEVRELWHYNISGNQEPKKGDIERIFKKVTADFPDTVDSRAFSLANDVGGYFDTLDTRKMGIRTGFTYFDEMVSGLKDGKLYLIGARPTTGKTTFITQVLTNIAEQGIPCLFFPTEVGAEPIVDKIISRKGKIELKKFQNGTFNDQDVSKMKEFREYLKGLPLTIYEDFGLNIDSFEQEIDKYAPKVVVLDYFQALKWNDPSSVGEKESAVRRIKKITKDRNIITICLSQLTRPGQNSGKVSLSELKGTGALEELGDVIAQMYRDDDGKAHWPIPISLVVTKSKYSATGNIYLDFDNTICTFKENETQLQRGK